MQCIHNVRCFQPYFATSQKRTPFFQYGFLPKKKKLDQIPTGANRIFLAEDMQLRTARGIWERKSATIFIKFKWLVLLHDNTCVL